MWRSLRRNVLIIAVLAVANIAIMKYNKTRYESDKKVSTLMITGAEEPARDSLSPRP
ncbi:hypothetical protein [Taibaiella koreensis]|uniref:hypothetical protein n=1 Tax=Taibaiella koreensis TaxID=1268548 RepID=UPI0013C2AF9B|nr:hypothetical protein [Taibaiella koreensis]